MSTEDLDPTIAKLFADLAENLERADLTAAQRIRFAEILIEWGIALQQEPTAHQPPP